MRLLTTNIILFYCSNQICNAARHMNLLINAMSSYYSATWPLKLKQQRIKKSTSLDRLML